MQRRSFLVSSGVALFGFSIGSGSRPALGVEFQISGDIEEDPADVTSILIDFSKLDIIPHYLDVDNQDYVQVSVSVEIEDSDVTNSVEESVGISNGERSQIEDKFSPMVLDGFDFSDTSQVNGSVIIGVEHPDVSESYNQSFSITTPDIPDQFVTNYDFNDGANGWTETNSPDVSVSSSIADIDYTGETSAGLLQTMELSVEGQYEIEVRGSTNDGAQQQKTTIRDSSSQDYLSANISNFDRVDIFSTSLETKSDTFQVDDSGSVEVRAAANYRADCRVDYVSIKYIG